MIQVGPPPVFHASFFQVSWPNSPGPGIVLNFHSLLAGFRIVGRQKTANPVFAASNANDDRLVHDERRSCHREAVSTGCTPGFAKSHFQCLH